MGGALVMMREDGGLKRVKRVKGALTSAGCGCNIGEYKAKKYLGSWNSSLIVKDVAGRNYPRLCTQGVQATERLLLRVTKTGHSPNQKANFRALFVGGIV